MSTSQAQCSIIIPVCNKWELTKACLASIREHSSGHDLEIIVVDNGSSDATAAELAPYGSSLFGPRFSALVFNENRNFGPACNAGAKAASSAVLFFLNNDTLLTPGCLAPLFEALNTENAPGALGPLLLYPDDSVQHLGVTYGTNSPEHLYQHFPSGHPVVSKKRNLQSITGAAFLIRHGFFHECGGFFEDYKNGFEDLDLCVQITRRGRTLRCVPESKVYHLEGQSQGRKDWDDHNSRIFTSRCGQDVYTDIHLHALRDGFEVFISDLLTVCVKLKDKDELRLAAQAQGKDASTWLNLTRENPYWLRGREILAHSLEQARQYDQAADLRAELAQIEPTLARYRALLGLAPHLQDTSGLGVVEKHMQTILRFQSDAAFAKSFIREVRQRQRPGGDAFLEELYAKKLNANFGTGRAPSQ